MLDLLLAFSWQTFHFLRPWAVLLILPFVFLWLYQYKKQNRKQRWKNILAPHLLAVLHLSGDEKKLFSPLTLFAVLIIVATLIVMGPSWTQQISPLEEDKSIVYIALDVSASMKSSDVKPSRLERAKQKIMDFLSIRQSGVHGLLVYSGSAHAVLPPTNDAAILMNYLNAISTDIMPLPGKVAENILPLIVDNQPDDSGSINILLLTDGVSDKTISEFDRFFAKHHYQLFIVGVGLDVTQIREDNQRQSANGDSELSGIAPLDRAGLEKLAGHSAGEFVELTYDNSDMLLISRRIKRNMVLAEDSQTPWQDAGYYLVFICLFLLLPWFRKGWTLKWSVLLFMTHLSYSPPVSAVSFMDLWLTPEQQGKWYFERKNYKKSAEHFENLNWKATAYYMAEDFTLAAEYFSRISGETALFNQANALAHAQRYLPALKVYDRLLTKNSNYPAAVENRKIVQLLVDEINRQSAAQQDDPGSGGEADNNNKEMEERAEGAERKRFGKKKGTQYSADELLHNSDLREQWMRNVEPDPSRFLSARFYLQESKRQQESKKKSGKSGVVNQTSEGDADER